MIALMASALLQIAAITPAEADAVQMLPPMTYQAFDNHTETLIPWQGRKVSVLVDQGVQRDPVVMQRLVGTLDAAYDYYAISSGKVPAPGHSLNGRDTIAEVTSTCGAGCGYLGANGVELQTQFFEVLYTSVAQNNTYDQAAFYELGRNFWFWGSQLAFRTPEQDPVVTGYAVWMRFRSMDAAGATGAPFNGTPFGDFRSQVATLIDQYEGDPSLTFGGTLAQAKSPGLYGGTDFWASIMMRLAARHGNQAFVERFFRNVSTLPDVATTAGAVTNWVHAASDAACADLSSVFYDRWGFPRPDGSVTARPRADSVPEPISACHNLVSVNSGKNLDVAGASKADGARVIQWPDNGGANQQWRFEGVAPNTVRVVSVNSGKVLDVGGASQADGAAVIQWPWNGGANQQWRIEAVAANTYRLLSVNSGKVLDVGGASQADGAAVIQWPWNGGANQQWRLTSLP